MPGDSKDWTWVLERPCPECGIDPAAIDVADVPAIVRDNAAAWQVVLARPDVRRRPRPDVWSPLEYGCHVRDVFRLFDLRLGLMLDEDDPLFANWDQDETAVAERYDAQDPAVVAGELAAAGDAVAASFAAVERRAVGARRPAQRRRRVHRAVVRPLLRPRPRAPPLGRRGLSAPTGRDRAGRTARAPGPSRVSCPVVPPAPPMSLPLLV